MEKKQENEFLKRFYKNIPFILISLHAIIFPNTVDPMVVRLKEGWIAS